MSDETETLRLRADGLTWREIEGEVVVLDRRTWAYLSVNASGAGLWEKVVAGTTADELVDRLVAAHELPRDRARADVSAFIEVLREHDLLDV